MPEPPFPPLTVFRKEPLMRFIAATGLSPVGLGIAFLLTVSLSLTWWAYESESPAVAVCPGLSEPRNFVSFFENISWSISIVFLFPLVVALTLKYYREIPKLFAFLAEQTDSRESGSGLKDFHGWLDRRFNSYGVTVTTALISLVLNVYYFKQILEDQPCKGWMNSGEIFAAMTSSGWGLTPIGLYAGVIQFVLIYWVLNLVWRGAVLAWGLHEFFNKRDFPVRIQPLHPDRCCGLRKIGDVAMLLNLTLFLLGIYLSLKVIDKIVIQGSPLSIDIGNPVMLGSYLIIAPLLFFFPLGAAHRQMSAARDKFLEPLRRRLETLMGELAETTLDDRGRTAVQTFSALDAEVARLNKAIPVWPFDFRSLRAFAGTIVIPVFPVVFPYLLKLVFGG